MYWHCLLWVQLCLFPLQSSLICLCVCFCLGYTHFIPLTSRANVITLLQALSHWYAMSRLFQNWKCFLQMYIYTEQVSSKFNMHYTVEPGGYISGLQGDMEKRSSCRVSTHTCSALFMRTREKWIAVNFILWKRFYQLISNAPHLITLLWHTSGQYDRFVHILESKMILKHFNILQEETKYPKCIVLSKQRYFWSSLI